jgi:integrase/recombinase XerD
MNDLITQNSELEPGTWDEAQSIKKNTVWNNLKSISVHEAIERWLKTLSDNTRSAYAYGMKSLVDRDLIRLDMNLQIFSLVNFEAVIDEIKLVSEWQEATRQARAACFISFTKYLARQTEGMIRKAIPSSDKKTFHKIRNKVTTPAMDKVKWTRFFQCLESQRISEIGKRDALIGKIMLQGGKRVSEVLSLEISQIDWEEKIIHFDQIKTRGYQLKLPIHYREQNLVDLKRFLNGRTEGLVFLTPVKTYQTGEKEGQEYGGKPISRHHITRSFERAGRKAEIPFKVTPHVMRASLVSHLKSLGYSNSDIRKITGHASDEMIDSYDKTSPKDNPSKQEYLV